MAKVAVPNKILLIDDDTQLIQILSMRLRQEGYETVTASKGVEGLALAQKYAFDGIVLDLSMPEKDGFAVCQELRSHGVMTPVLILSGITDKVDIVQALEIGADGYLTKPFDGGELTARLSALIRRNTRAFPSKHLHYGGLLLHVDERKVYRGKQNIYLTPIETVLLSRLMQHAPDAVPRQALFEEVWGIDNAHSSNRLDAYIRRLRQKLASLPGGPKIHTLHSSGYRLDN